MVLNIFQAEPLAANTEITGKKHTQALLGKEEEIKVQ